MPARAEGQAVMFVGPTMATSPEARALARLWKGAKVRRPVRRHDIETLVSETKAAKKKPGVIVIVDGVFQDTLAVGHAELREALERGWTIWGLSSMGAIRAREMAHLGMRGFGEVFARFDAEEDFQDDEVALLHEPNAPYRPVSEPLVHLRAALAHLVARGLLSEANGDEVVFDLKSRWYGERTVRRLAHAVRERALGSNGARDVERELRAFDRFRVKTLDLVRFLEKRPFDEVGPETATARLGPSM